MTLVFADNQQKNSILYAIFFIHTNIHLLMILIKQ